MEKKGISEKMKGLAVRAVVSAMASVVVATVMVMTGCRAKREVVEESAMAEKVTTVCKTTAEENVEALMERNDRVVLENPEIVVQEAGSGAMMTVRGTRLVRSSDAKAEVEVEREVESDVAVEAEAERASECGSVTECGSGGIGMRCVIIAMIVVGVVVWLKRRA